MQKPLDGEWGRVLKGKWTGLVGDIVYHVTFIQYYSLPFER